MNYNINKNNKVSQDSNYHHNDIKYTHPGLINAQTQMFAHYLNQFEGPHRKYNSTDMILDIPKIKLWDKASHITNAKKVARGEKQIRLCVAKLLQSPIIKHCCAGAFANFERTVYKPTYKSKFYNGYNNKYYHPKYAKFHPHVHITLITKPHKANSIMNVSALRNQIQHNQRAGYHKTYRQKELLKQAGKINPISANDVQITENNRMTTNLSSGDCTAINQVWNNAINRFGANQLGNYTIPKGANHFYVKPTYIKANTGHVHAYWSLGWNAKIKDYSQPGKIKPTKASPLCYAKPTSRTINDLDNQQTIYDVAHDLGSESNKYRQGMQDFMHSCSQGNAQQAIAISKHEEGNPIHGLGAVYRGYYKPQMINHQFPRHMYFGKLYQYAKKNIFPQFPREKDGEKYKQFVKPLHTTSFHMHQHFSSDVQTNNINKKPQKQQKKVFKPAGVTIQ